MGGGFYQYDEKEEEEEEMEGEKTKNQTLVLGRSRCCCLCPPFSCVLGLLLGWFNKANDTVADAYPVFFFLVKKKWMEGEINDNE